MKHFPIIILLCFTTIAVAQFPSGIEEQAEAYIRKSRNPGLVVALIEGGRFNIKALGKLAGRKQQGQMSILFLNWAP